MSHSVTYIGGAGSTRAMAGRESGDSLKSATGGGHSRAPAAPPGQLGAGAAARRGGGGGDPLGPPRPALGGAAPKWPRPERPRPKWPRPAAPSSEPKSPGGCQGGGRSRLGGEWWLLRGKGCSRSAAPGFISQRGAENAVTYRLVIHLPFRKG